MDFNNINERTPEGKLLIMAIAAISTMPGYTDKTPQAIMNGLIKMVDEVYGPHQAIIH